MRRDYRFLIGHAFSVAGETYVVRDLTTRDDHTVVEAGRSDGEASSSEFSLAEVIERLIVDEEIELFNPNYLTAL